ncbi:hypothetical protein ABID92_001879 [Frigoribacterium sp. PvP120]|uniref:hypothetical protein n=1 Tax=unclassified Frigoribacterium TaxID=2627005 RepID=UPI001AE3E6D4|nr:hypothetical protein [Frigoribacterium sp. PvP121]MBP1240181.1 hypothetical protein [Frigoribacterium sp. PvP121]
MITPTDLRGDLVSYLARTGWTPGRPGRYGELWTSGLEDDARLAVPSRVDAASPEYRVLVSLLAERERRTAAEVGYDIARQHLDIQNFRIADSYVSDGSVMLESAATVLSSARRLIRAAATTSRKPKAAIRTGYSKPADEIADKARLSHTRIGSFVLPVVLPLSVPDPDADRVLASLEEVTLETAERRVTRTLASALNALDLIAVRPDREASTDDVLELVERGVSKELVNAVRAIATDSGVHAFEVGFAWAPSAGTPGALPQTVKIAEAAAPLLGRVEQRLGQVTPRPEESVSGQIVEIRQIPDASSGEISIRTVRSGRTAEVRVTVSNAIVLDAADWFRSGRAVLAYGRVEAKPGRPLIMSAPVSVVPMDAMLLDDPSVNLDTSK